MIALSEIQEFFEGRIRLSEPLAPYTGIGIGGEADYFFEPTSSRELAKLLDYFIERGVPYVIVHSNMLVNDNGFRGAAVFLGADDSDGPQRKKGLALFKNPAGTTASRFIESLGLGKVQKGGVSIAPGDSNTLVNKGRATAEDVLALIQYIQAESWRRARIELESDVQLVGFEQQVLTEAAA